MQPLQNRELSDKGKVVHQSAMEGQADQGETGQAGNVGDGRLRKPKLAEIGGTYGR